MTRIKRGRRESRLLAVAATLGLIRRRRPDLEPAEALHAACAMHAEDGFEAELERRRAELAALDVDALVARTRALPALAGETLDVGALARLETITARRAEVLS